MLFWSMRNKLFALIALMSFALFGAQTSVSAQSIEVRVAPPTVRVETRGAPPSPRHVWVPGYWQWDGNAYVWTSGKWDVPPRSDFYWREPRWLRRGQGWILEPGQWIGRGEASAGGSFHGDVIAPPAPPIEIDVRPPPVKYERRSYRPGPEYVWISGYWAWDGQQYVWTNGRWEVPHEEGAVWVAPRWHRHGRRWSFEDGRWQARRRARIEDAREHRRDAIEDRRDRREDRRGDRIERHEDRMERREDRVDHRQDRRQDRREGRGHRDGHR